MAKKQHQTRSKNSNLTNQDNLTPLEFSSWERVSPVALLDNLELGWNGYWFEPPIPFQNFINWSKKSPTHESAIQNVPSIVQSTYVENDFLNSEELFKIVMDYKLFGNAFIELIRNGFGTVVGSQHLPCYYMRAGKEQFHYIILGKSERQYEHHQVLHLKQYDPKQSRYGLPDYMSLIESVLVKSNAMLYRTRYYSNNAQPGLILMSKGALGTEEIKRLFAR